MSTRTGEKQRRTAECLQAGRGAAAQRQRAPRLPLAAGAIVAVLAVGAVAAVVGLGGGNRERAAGAGGGRALAAGELGGAFGQHYAGLDARRRAAGVTTMMDTMGSPVHFHPRLAVFADGKRLDVPANIGIDPRRDGMQMASLHTHDDSGVIHVEGQERATLGQFFAVWGVPLGSDRLGSYRRPVRMWVDGKPSRAFGNLKLADRQKIVLAVGRGGPKQ